MIAALAGCAPKELSSIQGEWRFDEAAFLASLREENKSGEDLKSALAIHEMLKQKGFATMSDLSVSGSRIIALSGLRQQWDLSDYRAQDGRVLARAVWHEDRNDAGKTMPMDLEFEIKGQDLFFTMRWDGVEEKYVFHKK